MAHSLNNQARLFQLTTRPVVGKPLNSTVDDSERNAQLAAIVMSSGDAIISVGLDLKVRTWNPGAEALFGYTEAEAVGRPVDELIVPADLIPERQQIYEAVRSGKQAIIRETQRKRKDGSLVPVEINASPMFDASGAVRGQSVIFRDVTERRRAEAQLRESEERLASALKAGKLGVHDFDPRNGEVNWDATVRGLWGVPADEPITYDAFKAGVHPDDMPALQAKVEEALNPQGTGRYEAEYRIIRRMDGAIRWVVADGDVTFENGVAVRLVGTVHDITERKQAEAELRDSEERFRTVVETAQEGIWTMDRAGITTLVNPSMAEMLGYSPEDMIGRPVTDFCFPENFAELKEHLDIKLEGISEQIEFRLRRADGTPIDVLAATTPTYDQNGAIIGAMAGVMDLRERKRAEERQAVLMREVLHRGKNLLAVIQSIASRSLSGPVTLDEARDAFLGRLHALARTYGALTNEAFEGAPLDEIVRDELSSFGGRAEIAGPPLMLTAKAAQTLALTVHELATNAAKYGSMSQDQGRLSVTWQITGVGEDRRLRFDWKERSGPPASPPSRRGFGSKLIADITGSELQCQPELHYSEQGFRYSFEAPLPVIGRLIEGSPVRRKLVSETLRDFYDAWTRAAVNGDAVPIYSRFDRHSFASSETLTVARLEDDRSLTFLEVGKALTERLGRPIGTLNAQEEDSAKHAEAYRRCANRRGPCYEHLRFDFGDGDPVTFERLLLPFSHTGKKVSHLVGMVVYSGTTNAIHHLQAAAEEQAAVPSG